MLTKSQKRANAKYRKNHPDILRMRHKNWRKKNPVKWSYFCSHRRSYLNDATKSMASFYYSLWQSDEVEYLVRNALNKTALQIALDLGRTLRAVYSCAHRKKIKLDTVEKHSGLSGKI